MSRIAMLSVHTCPLAALGGKETGGMNVYVREVARELGRLAVAVDVFTRSQDPAIPRVVQLGERARVIHLPAGPTRPIPRAAVAGHLEQFVAGVEAFRREHALEYALIHSHYWLSGLAGIALARSWARPLVHMFHTLGAIKNAVARGSGDVEPEERIAAERRIAAAADRLVASNLVERADLAWHCAADPDRVAVIPCGVDLELFRPGDPAAARRRLGLGQERVLLFVGRLTPIKGLETLLQALAGLAGRPEVGGPLRLVVVGGDKEGGWGGAGDGGLEARGPEAGRPKAGTADDSTGTRWPGSPEIARFRRLAAELGIASWMDFRGPQPQGVLPDYYAAADLCLMPSRYESFGMVALEAMACGVPVVGSRVGGLGTTVQPEVTGLLVPEGDPQALRVAIAGLLADEEHRRALGRQAVEWARRFAWPCVARKVRELYGELVPALGGPVASSRCQAPL